MLKLALSQLRAAPRRYISVLLAILIGVTFLASAMLVGSSSNATLRESLGSTYSKADLVVVPSQSDFEASEALGRLAGPPATSDEVTDENGEPVADLGALNEVDGVAEAHPSVAAGAGLTLPQNVVDSGQEGTYTSTSDFAMVVPVPQNSAMVPDALAEGDYPSVDSSNEITVDAATAERLKLDVGDQTTLQLPTFVQETGEESAQALAVTIVGITERSSSPFSIGAAQLYSGTDLFSALNLQPFPGEEAPTEYSTTAEYVLIDVADGASPTTVAAAVQDRLDEAGITATVDTPDAAAQAQVADMAGSNVFVYILAGFAVIALIVTMLVISNTFSVLVAQRTRQLALQRVLGATRGQVRGAVLTEALLVGLIGSVLGVALASGLVAALVAIGRTIEGMGAVTFAMDPVSLGIVILIGILMTVVASLIPAARATRVSPLAAMRPVEDTTVGSRAGIVRMILGGLLVLIGVGLLVLGATQGQLLIAVGGGALSFIGLLMLAVLFVPGAVFAVGALVRSTGVPGRMAQLNSVRNRSRTASTATALLVGTTLVAMMLTGGKIAQDQADSVLGANYPVDLYTQLNPENTSSVEDAEQTARQVQDLDGVNDALALPQVGTLESGDAVYAVDPDDVDQMAAQLPAEDREALREPGTVVLPEWAASNLGETTTLPGANGELSTHGTDASSLDALISTENAERLGLSLDTADAGVPILWINVTDDVSMDSLNELIAEIGAAAEVTPEGISGPVAERILYTQIIDMMLLIVTALLAVSVLIALIGVANTLSLSTIERTRENSLMRALGLTKQGLRGMLAMEAVLVSGVAALLGSILGVVYGWFGAQTVFGELRVNSGLTELVPVTVPWLNLLAILAVAVLAGLLASVAPARRAVKLQPVEGLAVE
ncbi:MAG: ABC transporter permease [Micrococcaceae bacterium]